MNEKDKKGRFGKLEYWPIIKKFRRDKTEKRFERLEIDGHKIAVQVRKETEEQVIVCPKCNRRTPKETAYCLYCEHVFNETVVEQNEKDIALRPWQMRCPRCSRVIPRKENSCLFCGWIDDEKQTAQKEREKSEDDLLREGETVIFTIDGQTYSSKDSFLPPDVKELMLKIKKEGYSGETIGQWLRVHRPLQRSRDWLGTDWLGRRQHTGWSQTSPIWIIIARIIPLVLFILFYFFSCFRMFSFRR